MSMRTKYKLGQRILFIDEDGIEHLATITGITTSIYSDGTKTIYNYNKVIFNESQIVGIVSVYKPRSRAKKKIEELKKMGTSSGASTPLKDSTTTANANGAA